MKYIFIVKENFTDKYTDEKYVKGKELTVDEARGEELLKVPELVELKEKVEERITNTGETTEGLEGEKIENPEKSVEETTEEDELEALREKAKELGIKVTKNMKKETIIEKINEIEAAEVKE